MLEIPREAGANEAALALHGLMPVDHDPLLQRLEFGAHSFGNRLALDSELPVLPRMATHVREPQEVERLRFSLSPLLAIG